MGKNSPERYASGLKNFDAGMTLQDDRHHYQEAYEPGWV